MDSLISAIQQQFADAKDRPLRLLQLQNNLYGCFLVMEDIAERLLYVTPDHHLTGEHVSLNLMDQFHQIGMRFGFIMDQRAQLDPVDIAYRDAWIQWFCHIDTTHDIQEVDAAEDALNEIIRTDVPSDMGFFINASETGSLSQAWISTFLTLVEPPSAPSSASVSPVQTESALIHAKTESPIIRSSRRLAHTRRHPNTQRAPSKKQLAKTRRSRV